MEREHSTDDIFLEKNSLVITSWDLSFIIVFIFFLLRGRRGGRRFFLGPNSSSQRSERLTVATIPVNS